MRESKGGQAYPWAQGNSRVVEVDDDGNELPNEGGKMVMELRRQLDQQNQQLQRQQQILEQQQKFIHAFKSVKEQQVNPGLNNNQQPGQQQHQQPGHPIAQGERVLSPIPKAVFKNMDRNPTPVNTPAPVLNTPQVIEEQEDVVEQEQEQEQQEEEYEEYEEQQEEEQEEEYEEEEQVVVKKKQDPIVHQSPHDIELPAPRESIAGAFKDFMPLFRTLQRSKERQNKEMLIGLDSKMYETQPEAPESMMPVVSSSSSAQIQQPKLIVSSSSSASSAPIQGNKSATKSTKREATLHL